MTLKTFQQAFREADFTVTVELPLGPTTTADDLRRNVARLRGHVDAVQITDAPGGLPHMAPLVAAGLCINDGMDAVVQMIGRDKNRVALESDILGAAAAGVSTLVMMRGDRIPDDVTPTPRTVYELGAKRLLCYASMIGEEARLTPRPGFLLGAKVRAVRPDDSWHPREIEAKADVGCKFVQTQPVLNLKMLSAYMEKLVGAQVLKRVSVIVSVPLVSKTAEFDALLKRRAAVAIPVPKLKRIMDSENPGEAGIESCVKMVREVRKLPGIAGVNLVGVANCESAAEVISLSEIYESR